MKGVSPLIAAILLIAFTLAIAGILGSWATRFSQQGLEKNEEKESCVGALGLRSPSFSGTLLTVQVTNQKTNFNLSGMAANVIYANATKTKAHSNIAMKDLNFMDPMPPGYNDWIVYDTKDSTKPLRVEVFAANCGTSFSADIAIP
ncbi:MAG: hypothetical protein HYW26_00495 [Candidatus Aenigmarchaeota archaeon]|nr:hypothetical protein [Candidatus Aenigmarchaeota archaeon]